MRVVLTNFGSTGDVQPLLALAVELRRNGHQPIVAVAPNFGPWIEQFGLRCTPVGPDTQDALRTAITTRVEMGEFFRSVDEIRAFLGPLVASLPQVFADLRAICRDADVLVCGATQPAGRMIHELTGIPFVSLFLGHPGALGTAAMQQARFSLINPFRAELGLPPLHDPLTSYHSPQLALYAMSRHVVPPAASWPLHYLMTGYFFLDDERWQPSAALAEFIAAAEPPVVFSFGSMTHADPQAFTALVLETVRRVGCRAIIQKGWSGLDARDLPPDVFMAEYVPHAWLFPRAACVIHHGGAGTCAAALRAGVPSLILPHNADQPLWAQTLHELGCAGPVMAYGDISAERLSRALTTILSTLCYREAAAALGQQIRAEHGVKKARQSIEELVARAGLHGPTPADAPVPADLADDRQAKPNRRQLYQQRQRARRQGVDDE
ncbi:MAG TPA: glycosyltransferase [Herpetosiphonaceae bacterium]